MPGRIDRCIATLAATWLVPSPALAAKVKPKPGQPGQPPNAIVVKGVETRVLARGLSRPTGIVAGDDGTLYFTEIPMPGAGGGANGVSALDVASGEVVLLHQGEPEPVNIAIGRESASRSTATVRRCTSPRSRRRASPARWAAAAASPRSTS